MSYYCDAKREVVQGEKMVKVPIELRPVKYTGTVVIKSRRPEEEDKVIIIDEWMGTEIVREVAVSHSLAEKYKAETKPLIRQGIPKNVTFIYRKPKKATEFRSESDRKPHSDERE